MGWRLTLIAALLLTSCLTPGAGGQTFSSCENADVILLPHHLLVETYIEEMYESIADKSTEKVIIIGPNHFGLGQHDIEISQEDEFSFTIHRDFAKQYFPNAEIEGYMLRPEAGIAAIDWLLDEITDEDALFVFTVDFSHYLPGNVSLVHDLHSKDVIEARSAADARSLEVDSPTSIELMLKLMEARGLTMNILLNTNPALDADIETFENTTHQFGCSTSGTPPDRQINSLMEFAHPEVWYKGLTEEDRYLYGYDETTFNVGGEADQATIEHLNGDTEKYIFDYFE